MFIAREEVQFVVKMSYFWTEKLDPAAAIDIMDRAAIDHRRGTTSVIQKKIWKKIFQAYPPEELFNDPCYFPYSYMATFDDHVAYKAIPTSQTVAATRNTRPIGKGNTTVATMYDQNFVMVKLIMSAGRVVKVMTDYKGLGEAETPTIAG